MSESKVKSEDAGTAKAKPRKKKAVKRAFETVALDSLTPASINGSIYKPLDPDGERVQSLAKKIKLEGLLQPLHVTTDNVIVSGHTRAAACKVAGLTHVDIIRETFASTHPQFAALLVSHNDQRVKTPAEQIRESIVRIDPGDAHNKLLAERATVQQSRYRRLKETGLRIIGGDISKTRNGISDAKMPMLNAAIEVLNKYRNYWPLTLRQVHYRLLGQYVLRHAKKPDSVYDNTRQSYNDLSDLLTRARLNSQVPWESLHDPTRPFTHWRQWDSVGDYTRQQFDKFLTGYKRNLLIGQPSYVELVVEKLTVQDIAQRAAGHYHVPVGVGRGYSSATSLEATAERFRASGSDHFVLLVAGDLDPEGENIAETWANHLVDEHDIGAYELDVVKVAVNPKQISEYNLAPIPAKETSSRHKGYSEQHGDFAYELEAFEPDALQAIIRDAIRNVLDLNVFAQQQRQESEDARYLMALRGQLQETFGAVIIENPD